MSDIFGGQKQRKDLKITNTIFGESGSEKPDWMTMGSNKRHNSINMFASSNHVMPGK